MEYVYKLNLPTIEHVFLSTFTGFDDDDIETNYQYRTDVGNIIRPEWLTFRNLGCDHLLYFKKLNASGKIHTDIGRSYIDTEIGKKSTPWGITWVFEGDGLLEYWPFEDVINSEITNGSNNDHSKGIVRTYTSNVPPTKSYYLSNGSCYLVCGKYPHKATGFGGRKVISLRSFKLTHNISWEEIVSRFSDLITE